MLNAHSADTVTSRWWREGDCMLAVNTVSRSYADDGICKMKRCKSIIKLGQSWRRNLAGHGCLFAVYLCLQSPFLCFCFHASLMRAIGDKMQINIIGSHSGVNFQDYTEKQTPLHLKCPVGWQVSFRAQEDFVTCLVSCCWKILSLDWPVQNSFCVSDKDRKCLSKVY